MAAFKREKGKAVTYPLSKTRFIALADLDWQDRGDLTALRDLRFCALQAVGEVFFVAFFLVRALAFAVLRGVSIGTAGIGSL